MSLIKPSIVLFDMDGTTVRHINPKMLAFLEKLDDISHNLAMFCNYVTFGCKKRQNVHATPLKHSPSVGIHKAIHSIRRRPVNKIVQPCPGIFTLLDFLKNRNIPIGLLSNGLGKGYGHDVLETFGLAPYYSAVTFREDIRFSKPHPQPVLMTIDKIRLLQSSREVVWYIGDQHKDVTAAIAASDYFKGTIIPFAYGFNASMAILERGLSRETIILNYNEFTNRIMPLFT